MNALYTLILRLRQAALFLLLLLLLSLHEMEILSMILQPIEFMYKPERNPR